MNKDLLSQLSQYYEIQNKIKSLGDIKESLRSSIVKNFKENSLEKVESTFGTFTICKKKTYKFTEAVKKIEERLKIAKIKEQQKGIAEEIISEYLLFTSNDK